MKAILKKLPITKTRFVKISIISSLVLSLIFCTSCSKEGIDTNPTEEQNNNDPNSSFNARNFNADNSNEATGDLPNGYYYTIDNSDPLKPPYYR